MKAAGVFISLIARGAFFLRFVQTAGGKAEMINKLHGPSRGMPRVQPGRHRYDMTVSCRDCDSLPKCENAGAVVEEAGDRFQIMHNGLRVVADGYYGAEMTEIISTLHGHHEPQEEYVFHQILQRIPNEATMIEIGGYWAYYSLWFKSLHPSARRAIVVEPVYDRLEVGSKNARLNNLNIEFLEGGVGAQSRDYVSLLGEKDSTVNVRTYTLKQIFAECSVKRVDILHCDAQGIELPLLQSSKNLLEERCIDFLFLSTHHYNITHDYLTHQRCLDWIIDMGGKVIAEHDVHESFSGDGLIVAYFGIDEALGEPIAISRNRYSNALYRNPLFDLDEMEQKFRPIVSLLKAVVPAWLRR